MSLHSPSAPAVGPNSLFQSRLPRARMKALMNLPSTCGAMASTSTPWSCRNTRASSILWTRVGSISICSNPASVELRTGIPYPPARRQCSLPTAERSGASPAGTSPCTTTSDTAKRPPGFNTRKASRSTRSLSAERLMTQFEMITSTELSGSGMFSISPFRNSTFSTPDLLLIFPRQRQHLVGHVEPIGFAGWPDAAGRKQNIDPAARAQIEHGFARVQLRQSRRIAAAQRGQRAFRESARLRNVVEVRRDGVATTLRRRGRAATGTAPAGVTRKAA